MDFYLEAMRNDIDIASLDCDIELDKAELTLNYYNSVENFYKESCNSEEEFFLEAHQTIGQSITNIIKSVINFINTCANKVRELFTGKKIKDLKQRYEEAIRKNPKLKDAKINFPYDDTWIKIQDKNNLDMYLDISKMANASSEEIYDQISQKYEQRKKERKEFHHKYRHEANKDAAKAVTLISVATLLFAADARYIKNVFDREKLLKQIENKAEETESKRIKALAKLAHDKEYKSLKTKGIRRLWINLIDNIKGTTRDELTLIMGAVAAIDAELKKNKSIDDAAADNMAILNNKK
jgi:hypothetical protein